MGKQGVTPRKADLSKLKPAGTYLTTEESAAHRLARAIHAAESASCVTSWSAQERAQEFYNEHGLAPTLNECERLELLRRPDADN